MSPALFLICAFLAVAPMGCTKTTLSPTGVYHGDVFLYQAEKVIVTAHSSFQSFLKWEMDYRSVLPVEVSQAADVIRLNEKRWIDAANSLHDAYVNTPTQENKDKFQLALNLISTALDEAAKFMVSQKSKAPNTGLIVKPTT